MTLKALIEETIPEAELRTLFEQGFVNLAQDGNGKIYAYTRTPEYTKNGCWIMSGGSVKFIRAWSLVSDYSKAVLSIESLLTKCEKEYFKARNGIVVAYEVVCETPESYVVISEGTSSQPSYEVLMRKSEWTLLENQKAAKLAKFLNIAYSEAVAALEEIDK